MSCPSRNPLPAPNGQKPSCPGAVIVENLLSPAIGKITNVFASVQAASVIPPIRAESVSNEICVKALGFLSPPTSCPTQT